jgi:putative ABC transport system permease protein
VDPAWLKAPLLLTRFPTILLSIVAGASILGATTSAAPLLLSSAGNAALAQELARIGDHAGLSVGVFGFIDPDTFHVANDAVVNAASDIEELSDATLTLEGTTTNVGNGRGETTQVRFLSRTGAEDHIEKLSRDTGSGMWIAASSASALGVRPGDELTIRFGDLVSSTTVRGIYRDLAASAPLPDYWTPLTFHIISPIQNQPPLHPYLIGDVATLLDVSTGIAQQATMTWDFALEKERLTLPEAKGFARRFDDIRSRAHDPLHELGRTLAAVDQFGGLDVETSLPSAIKKSEEAVAAIEGPVQLISLAGRLVALTVLAAAGQYAFTRRRVEARLLSAQGRTPWWQGAKASVEAALPAVIGASVGWLVGIEIVARVGPSDLISAGVSEQAARSVAWWTGAAIVLAGLVFGLSAHQETQLSSSRFGRAVARVPWEIICLSLAAASLYEVLTRGGAVIESVDQPPKIDLFLLAFPFLFIAGMAGLATRMLRRSLPRLRRASAAGSAWRFLAVRRFAGAQKGGLLLITASAIALGTFVYSATLVATTATTIQAKARVLAGSDLAAVVRDVEEMSGELGLRYTAVARSAGDLFPGAIDVDILAVDRSTFERGAFWDPSFAERPLDELLGELSSEGSRLPVILAGAAVPNEATVESRGKNIPIEVVARVEAWPGMRPNRGLIVADQETMSRIAVDLGATPTDPFATDELWIKGNADAALATLADAGVFVERYQSAAEIQETPALRALTWAFGFLQALGLLAGVIAVVGVTLNLQARQQAREISYALARRMGLSRSSHRLAIGGELVAMLAAAALSGGVFALVAARIISSQIDPLPGLPPSGIFQIPTGVVVGLPIVLVVISIVGAWLVQLRADRMNVAEVMRLAG